MRIALLIAVAGFAASSSGAAVTRTGPLPPIVFTSTRSDHDLVVFQADGTRRHTITASGRDDMLPSWSPDGTRVAFSHYNGTRERVDVLDLRTGRVRDLGEGSSPDWSPDGKQLVFLDAENFDDLVTMKADGTGRHKLNLTGAGIADETDPAWSPTGRWIAFLGDALYLVHPDGSNLHRLRPEGNTGRASWSPDGRRIAFDCAIRRYQVCTVRADGSGLRGLTNRGRGPAWSPRGGLIAVTTEDPTTTVLVRANGRRVRTIGGAYEQPDWSPSGRSLVGARDVGLVDRLYATGPVGRVIARLPRPLRGAARAPAWSPDRRRVAFRLDRRQCSIAVLDLATGRASRLVPNTRDSFCDDRPEWSPDGKRIVYSSRGDLWSVPSHGGHPRRLTRTRDSEQSPRFAPDHRSIAFVASGGIWLLRPSGRRTLLVAGGNAFSWSHDGAALAYLVYNPSNEGEGDDLYVRRGNDPPYRISEHVDFAPSWSPDGAKLAFTYTLDNSSPISMIVVSDLLGHTTGLVDDSVQPDWRP